MLFAFALSFVKLCWPLWEICHALKIKITYTPHIPTAPTLGVRKTCLPSRFTKKMFYSYIRSEQKNILDRFIHQINAPKFLLLSLKVLLQKRDMGLYKSYSWKKRKKSWEKKWTSVRDILNNGYLDAHLEKKRDE